MDTAKGTAGLIGSYTGFPAADRDKVLRKASDGDLYGRVRDDIPLSYVEMRIRHRPTGLLLLMR